ncbi:CHAT domain-containing protein [Aspergillus ambiguus]|uniref:CHAT domain-containing protein n=1 Tax=Aspergillus ambiguus TaxID=176160 RepID=UPI003CCD53F3
MAGQEALRISSSDHGSQAICLNNLSILHGYRFSKFGALDDLETATRMGEQALELISPNHPDRAIYLNDLSTCYERRFERLGDPTDIDKAINCSSEAVGLSRDGLDRGLDLENLSNALGSRFLIKGDVQDLSDAITHANQAIQCTPTEHQRYPHLLHNLSLHLEDRFRRYNNITDLEQAISLEEDAVSRVDTEDPRLIILWDELAVLLSLRCDLNDDIGLLDRAIELAEKVLDSISDDDDPDLAQYLSHMAGFLASRFERTGSLDDLDQSILLGRQAVDVTSNDDPHRADLLLDLSEYLHNRYIRLGSLEDNRQAVEIIQTAMQCQTEYASPRPSQLCTLSHRFRDRYESTKEKADIDQSIQLAQDALNRVPLDHPQRAYCLHSLSSALEKRFLVLGTLSDLEKSIEYSEKALGFTPLDRPDRIDYLYALSIQLTCRYELLGGLIDLEEAIHLMQSCIESAPPNYMYRVSCLKALSDQLGYLFERNMHTWTLDRAIEAANEAMNLVPEDDMMGSSILNSLHLLLISRFKITDNLSDLKSAIDAQREAIKRDSHYNDDRSILIHNLSVGLALYQRIGEPTDPTEAIKLSWEAVNTASEYHPNRAMYLNTCGTFLKNYERTRQIIPTDKKPQDLFLEALRHDSSPPLDRIKAGENAFDCYIANAEWTQANSVARDVVKLFPLLVPRWLSQDDQQHLLKNISHFTSHAASAVLQANEPPLDALKILEAGRGVIARCSIGLKTDISKLEESHPSLHDEYTMLRRQLSRSSLSTFWSAAEPDQPTLISRRRKAPGLLPPHITTTGPQRAEILRKLEHLEGKIRTIPGFGDFNQAPSHASYIEFAKFGPIVVFNVTEQRSDAIIVAENDIYSLHLERLRFQDLKANVARVIGNNRLSKGAPTTRPQRNRELQSILHWLWETAVHPVLTRLGLCTEEPPSVLPRVWWVASGYMGLLPLHAAGDAARSTMDYVISSYIPTLQVLQFCRERRRLSFRDREPRMLLVSAPEKLDRQTLKTNIELDSIREGLQDQVSYTRLDSPSRDDILRELSEHHLIHFSCHGYSNATDPSKSALELAFTAEDEALSQLTVRDLSFIGHEKAQIAYLSACSTAENSSDELLDEVIHIASAFQLIGFPHVVGTLWEVSDRAAVEVSRLFYEQLGRQISRGDESNIACCLHEGLQTYRKSRKVSRNNDVLSWAPFIYMGS